MLRSKQLGRCHITRSLSCRADARRVVIFRRRLVELELPRNCWGRCRRFYIDKSLFGELLKVAKVQHVLGIHCFFGAFDASLKLLLTGEVFKETNLAKVRLGFLLDWTQVERVIVEVYKLNRARFEDHLPYNGSGCEQGVNWVVFGSV